MLSHPKNQLECLHKGEVSAVTKNDPLLIKLVDSMARVESKLEQLSGIAGRLDIVEEKHTVLSTEIKTTKNVLWAILVSIPLVAGLLAMVGLPPSTSERGEIR